MFSFSRSNAHKPPWARKNTPPVEQVKLELEGRIRHFSVTLREGRVCFQDAENPTLQWATLDSWDGQGSYLEFWRTAIAERRIGRDVEITRGFGGGPFKLPAPVNATLNLEFVRLRVLAKEKGGGFARELQPDADTAAPVEAGGWMEFEPFSVLRVARPGAHLPSIFSSQWHLKFARRDLRQLDMQLARKRLSPAQWTLWQEGATHKPLRLLAAALQLGFGDNLFPNKVRIIKFWRMAFKEAAIFANEDLLPEAHLNGQISVSRYHSRYVLSEKEFTISVPLPFTAESAHERLEAYMELSDWLREAMSPAEATRMLADVKPGVEGR